MSQFWTDPWAAVESTRVLEIVHEQNHRYLEIGGEACYLLKRNASGESVTTIPSTGEVTLDPELQDFFRISLWDPSIPSDKYPELATVLINVNGVAWRRAFDKNSFTAGAQEFAVDEWKDRVDTNNDEIPNGVYAVLNTPPFQQDDLITFSYSTIAERISQDSMQTITSGDRLTARSVYGYTQYLNPTVQVRGRIIPHVFLLGFPNVPRDYNLVKAGLEMTASMRHWTQAPPYSPDIDEHDIIIRTSNNRRYEIKNMEKITHGGQEFQQQFDVVELNQDAPEYDLALVTV